MRFFAANHMHYTIHYIIMQEIFCTITEKYYAVYLWINIICNKYALFSDAVTFEYIRK